MRKIDNYPIPNFSEAQTDQINKIICVLNPEKVFLFWLETIAHQEGEKSHKISNHTLQITLTESFKRLSYELYHQLKNSGDDLTMSALILLLAHLDGIYQDQISEAPDFTDICDWDTQLTQTFEVLINFRSPKDDLVGEEYMQDQAITSAVLKEDLGAAESRITSIIDQVRAQFFRSTDSKVRQEVFCLASEGLAAQFIDLRETFRSEEGIVLNLIDEVAEYLDELYEEAEDIHKNRHTIRKNIPQKYSQFSPLLEVNAQEIAAFFAETFKIEVQPNLESIWSAIIEIVLSELELIEKNPLAQPPTSPAKKTSTLN